LCAGDGGSPEGTSNFGEQFGGPGWSWVLIFNSSAEGGSTMKWFNALMAMVATVGLAASAQAALSNGDILTITQGVGGFAEPAPGTGSWFAMEALGPGGWVYTGIGGATPGGPGIVLGSPQAAPTIDNGWTFFGNTGWHETDQTVDHPMAVGGDSVDMSGWYVKWGTPVGHFNMGAGADSIMHSGDEVVTANVVGPAYSLDYAAVVPADSKSFANVPYRLHLEGTVVPEPMSMALVGSSLIGLIGLRRRLMA